MSGPIAFVGDMHTCPLVAPPLVPHVGGAIGTSSKPTLLIDGTPVAGIGSVASCCGVPPAAPVIRGNPTFLTPTPVATLGCNTAHGGTIPMGNPTFIVV